MTEKEIAEALVQLRIEINRLDASSPATKARLEGLLNELEKKLDASENGEPHLHLIADLKDAISQFEVEHPRITGILNDLMITLSNLGI